MSVLASDYSISVAATSSKFVTGQLRFEVGQVNKGLLRRYFVNLAHLSRIAAF